MKLNNLSLKEMLDTIKPGDMVYETLSNDKFEVRPNGQLLNSSGYYAVLYQHYVFNIERPVKTKKVKLYAYLVGGIELRWFVETEKKRLNKLLGLKRIPSEDKEVEVFCETKKVEE